MNDYIYAHIEMLGWLDGQQGKEMDFSSSYYRNFFCHFLRSMTWIIMSQIIVLTILPIGEDTSQRT